MADIRYEIVEAMRVICIVYNYINGLSIPIIRWLAAFL